MTQYPPPGAIYNNPDHIIFTVNNRFWLINSDLLRVKTDFFVEVEADLALKTSFGNTDSAMRSSTTSVVNLVRSPFGIRRAFSLELLIDIGRQQRAPKGADASFRGCHTLSGIFSQKRSPREHPGTSPTGRATPWASPVRLSSL